MSKSTPDLKLLVPIMPQGTPNLSRLYGYACLFLISTVLMVHGVSATQSTALDNDAPSIIDAIANDHKSFYSCKRLTTDILAERVKNFGGGTYLIPLALLTSVNFFDDDASPGKWGPYTSRANTTGGPAVLPIQRVTGASHPGKQDDGSKWKPGKDENGASGHTAIGADPVLTDAQMTQENSTVKNQSYIASTYTAWTRVNDHTRYPSQATLGRYLGWNAADSVIIVNESEEKVTFYPMLIKEWYGVTISVAW